MESHDVKLARLEEGMVTVKGDVKYIRDKFDALSWKVLTMAGASSVVTSLVVALVVRKVMSP